MPTSKTTAKKSPKKAPKKTPEKPASAVHFDKLSLVIFYVRDPMASLAFYRDLLGMKVKEASPHWVELDCGGTALALHPHANLPEKRDAANPWVVFQVDDVHGAYQALLDKGVKFMSAPKQVCGDETYVGLSADLADPDGNLLSLFGMVPVPAKS